MALDSCSACQPWRLHWSVLSPQTGPSYYDDNVGRGTLTRLVIDTQVGWGPCGDGAGGAPAGCGHGTRSCTLPAPWRQQHCHALPSSPSGSLPPSFSLAAARALQTGTVAQHRLMERACEFPSVAPGVVGRPHTHQYLVGARFPGAEAWGAPQVRRGGLRQGA